jgi:DNA-binding transcriptional ArsR family regulator
MREDTETVSVGFHKYLKSNKTLIKNELLASTSPATQKKQLLVDISIYRDIFTSVLTECHGLISLGKLTQAAECLRVLAHPHRLRIVEMLLSDRYTVGELANACGIPSHMASEHLRLMKRCGFLEAKKEGRKAYYSIVEPHLGSIMDCIRARFA